jgi:hypothetical protein
MLIKFTVLNITPIKCCLLYISLSLVSLKKSVCLFGLYAFPHLCAHLEQIWNYGRGSYCGSF